VETKPAPEAGDRAAGTADAAEAAPSPTQAGAAARVVAGPALEARDLRREFAGFPALDGVSFQLQPGELLTVFGPNGAGKTTLLRVLGGGLRPTSGEVRLAGEPVDVGERTWRARIGVLSHRGFLYDQLSAAENLRFYGDLFGLDALADRVREALAAVGLAGRADARVGSFSRGMRQRLALARALLHDPDVVLLDEPWTGLDAHAAGLLRDVLASLKDGRRAVVLVTHQLGEGLRLADHVAIQVRGRFATLEPRADVPGDGFEAYYREVVERAAAGAGTGGAEL